MNIIKPILYKINAFDSSIQNTISFAWSGNQVFKNVCTIRLNSNNSVVYQVIQETMQLKHTIPSNVLINGTLYNATIKVIDSNNEVSEDSLPVLFYCFSTPSFHISNINNEQTIHNSSYQVTLTYTQSQNELLQSYQLFLYNTNKNQIWTSGLKYDTSNMNVSIFGLEDNSEYYVRAIGVTINGMQLDTGYIYFHVNYIQPMAYALVTLENMADEGSVKIQSNIISINATYYGDDPIYINDDFIDLTNPDTTGSYVTFNEGFSLDKNYIINIKGYGFIDHSIVLSMSDGKRTINLTKHKGTFASEGNKRKLYYELTVPNGISKYVIHSNLLDIPETENTDIYSIWIKCSGTIYDLYVKNLSTN